LKSAADVKTYGTNSTAFPANLMIDGLSPGSSGATPFKTWLKSIDSDHAWRQDGLPVFCDANPNLATNDPIDGTCLRTAPNPSRTDNRPTKRFRLHPTDTEWENGGHGNFPIWESCLLRPAFRSLFTHWENGSFFASSNSPQNFPDHGDLAIPDIGTSVSPESLVSLGGANYTNATGRYIGPDHRFILNTSNTIFAPRVLKLEYRVYKVGAAVPAWRVAYGTAGFTLPTGATEGQWRVEHRLTTPCNTLDPNDQLLMAPAKTETFIYDKTVPTSVLELRHLPNSAGWTRAETEVTIKGGDGTGSGMKEIRYSTTVHR
jgi:hypothetical protein